MKRLVPLLLSVLVLLSGVRPVQAVTVQDCRLEVQNALENVMGVPGRDSLHGYLQQLSDLTSTQLPTHLLLDEIETLARDARLELTSLCQELSGLRDLNDFYVAAYGLEMCQQLPDDTDDAGSFTSIAEYCQTRSDQLLDLFLERLRDYMTRQAVRTSIEPLIMRMRSLNERMVVLLTSYAQLVNNFYTFSFRLGDTIVGESD